MKARWRLRCIDAGLFSSTQFVVRSGRIKDPKAVEVIAVVMLAGRWELGIGVQALLAMRAQERGTVFDITNER